MWIRKPATGRLSARCHSSRESAAAPQASAPGGSQDRAAFRRGRLSGHFGKVLECYALGHARPENGRSFDSAAALRTCPLRARSSSRSRVLAVTHRYPCMPAGLRTGRPAPGRHVLLSSESCPAGTRARSGRRTWVLTVACGQRRRSAAHLGLDCFIAAAATRIRGGWMSVART